MKLSERLESVTRVFLDTAPAIYLVEKSPVYFGKVRAAFERGLLMGQQGSIVR